MKEKLSLPLGYGKKHSYSKVHKLHEKKESYVKEALEHIPRLTHKGVQTKHKY